MKNRDYFGNVQEYISLFLKMELWKLLFIQQQTCVVEAVKVLCYILFWTSTNWLKFCWFEELMKD
jgi:hypothetical protein